MSGDELSYVPTAMSQLHGNNTLIAGISASNMHPQGGSKRYPRRPRAMLDKQHGPRERYTHGQINNHRGHRTT